MKLIVVSGLPGAGKSTVAEGLGERLAVPVFAKDLLDAALLRSGLGDDPEHRTKVGYAGYELLATLAGRQLRLGQAAILDSVCGVQTAELSVARCVEMAWRRRRRFRHRTLRDRARSAAGASAPRVSATP